MLWFTNTWSECVCLNPNFKLPKEDIYVCTKPFGDGPYIGDFLVFNGTNN